MIYFAQAIGSPMIKIGMSNNVQRRMASLASKAGVPVVTLAVQPGGFADEVALHKRFSHLRRTGEWFVPGDDLVAYIGGLPPVDIPDQPTRPMTLHIPKPLHEAATKEAKARFMSLTGLILQALSKEVEKP